VKEARSCASMRSISILCEQPTRAERDVRSARPRDPARASVAQRLASGRGPSGGVSGPRARTARRSLRVRVGS
jgi:hypothetical protein